MPILWRYLLSHYLRVLFLCTAAFIGILLTLRLEEIARFASLGAEGIYVLLFVFYQIPYILPIAIPISALISATLLIQQLSHSHELTALRACGIKLREILSPLLIAAAFLSLFNFYVVSEWATQSHLTAGLLKSELRSVNPLLVLHNKHLMSLKGYYFDTLGDSRKGESAGDIVLAMPNKHNGRLDLVIAKQLRTNVSQLAAEHMTLISSVDAEKEEQFDPLLIENIAEATTAIKDFSQLLQKRVWSLNNDHLRMGLLHIRLEEDQTALAEAKQANLPISTQKQIQRSINRTYAEIIRRFAIALSAFTFTLMGASFGISISRNRSRRGVLIVTGLASIYLVTFFLAKGVDHLLAATLSLYLVPHLLIIGASLWSLHRSTHGIE